MTAKIASGSTTGYQRELALDPSFEMFIAIQNIWFFSGTGRWSQRTSFEKPQALRKSNITKNTLLEGRKHHLASPGICCFVGCDLLAIVHAIGSLCRRAGASVTTQIRVMLISANSAVRWYTSSADCGLAFRARLRISYLILEIRSMSCLSTTSNSLRPLGEIPSILWVRLTATHTSLISSSSDPYICFMVHRMRRHSPRSTTNDPFLWLPRLQRNGVGVGLGRN